MRCTIGMRSVAGSLLFCMMAGAADMRAKLRSMHLDSIRFEDRALAEVFRELRRDSRRLDPDGDGVNFVFLFAPRFRDVRLAERVNMHLRNIPLEEVIRYLCMVHGLDYRVEPWAILITDGVRPVPGLETRIYPIRAGVLDTPRTRRRAPEIDDWDDPDNGGEND